MNLKNKKEFTLALENALENMYSKTIDKCSNIEIYAALCTIVKQYANTNRGETLHKVHQDKEKQMYYFSLEFLIGRLLSNNLMNLGLAETAREVLADKGFDLNTIEDVEEDAGLGNGGLGRLAACFLDSLASLNLPGNGNTIRYQYGLFKQLIQNNEQVEVPDQWMKIGNYWETRKPYRAVDVKFWGKINVSMNEKGKLVFDHTDAEVVRAVPYDMPIVGQDTKCTNTLRLWNAEASNQIRPGSDFKEYLQRVNEITMNVYPDDSTVDGRYLRIKQEYFFVAAGLNQIINDHLKNYGTLDNLADKVVIQLNDTHPTLAIPELLRILMDEHNYEWDDAWNIVKHTFAYTNHTVLSEALEKWPVEFIKNLLPRIYLIIEEIDNRWKNYVMSQTNDFDLVNRVSIIHDNQVRMAHICIVGSFSVNGVAKIHSDILVNDLFKDFVKVYPNKFSNKTNGITQRRWLLFSNPELCTLLDKYIGKGYRTNFEEIGKLMDHVDDKKLQKEFIAVKRARKVKLANFLKNEYGIEIDPDSIFDSQAKRLHAYKRQLLNILHVIYLYQEIKKNPDFTMPKTTFLFGAKAAPAYKFAKKVIKLINVVASKIDNDPVASKYLKVVFIPNYRVTVAEYLMNATDISKQISTAGKEASGTGNMKYMMNGAITFGTMDGANVEIAELVGEENIEIFGLRAEEIMPYKIQYKSAEFYNSHPRIKEVVDSLVDGTFADDKSEFMDIYNELVVYGDEYLVMADFDSYVEAYKNVQAKYADELNFAKICLVNIAKSYYFSSDRTIKDYANEIWHIKNIYE